MIDLTRNEFIGGNFNVILYIHLVIIWNYLEIKKMLVFFSNNVNLTSTAFFFLTLPPFFLPYL